MKRSFKKIRKKKLSRQANSSRKARRTSIALRSRGPPGRSRSSRKKSKRNRNCNARRNRSRKFRSVGGGIAMGIVGAVLVGTFMYLLLRKPGKRTIYVREVSVDSTDDPINMSAWDFAPPDPIWNPTMAQIGPIVSKSLIPDAKNMSVAQHLRYRKWRAAERKGENVGQPPTEEGEEEMNFFKQDAERGHDRTTLYFRFK